MTHKDILLEVQKACHIDSQQCSALFEMMSRLMAQAGVEQVPVTIPGLGTFTSHKHPEYIQEDPQTGKQTLFPPRITYRMQTEEEEWTPNLLAKQLAEHLKLEPELTRSFMTALVNSIISALKRGDDAEVKGLGVFRVIASQQGELTRLAYTPDEQMRQLVNAPFNCFEPMPIENQAAPVAPIVEPVEEPVVKESVVEEPVIDEKTVEVEPDEIKPETQPMNDEMNEKVNAPISEEPTAKPAEDQVPSPQEEKQPEVVTIVAPKAEEKVTSAPAEPAKPKVTGNEIKEDDDDEDYYLERSRKKDNRILFYTLISLIVIACLAIFKFIYNLDRLDSDRNYVPPTIVNVPPSTPDEPEAPVEDTEASEQLADNTLDAQNAAAPETVAPAVVEPTKPAVVEPSKPAAVEPTKPAAPVIEQNNTANTNASAGRKKNPDGSYATHKLQGGETLRLVAEKYYGSREFWSFIYEVNSDKLPNPNNVPAGIVLYLPDASYYGIDASNPASISKAKSKGSQILNNQSK